MLFTSTFFHFSGPDGTQRLKLLFFYHTAIYSLAVFMFVESLSCPKVKLSWSKWGVSQYQLFNNVNENVLKPFFCFQLHQVFTPLVEKCKKYGRAMRIGTNHGSLSDRIMSYYGDSPRGMVNSYFYL